MVFHRVEDHLPRSIVNSKPARPAMEGVVVMPTDCSASEDREVRYVKDKAVHRRSLAAADGAEHTSKPMRTPTKSNGVLGAENGAPRCYSEVLQPDVEVVPWRVDRDAFGGGHA